MNKKLEDIQQRIEKAKAKNAADIEKWLRKQAAAEEAVQKANEGMTAAIEAENDAAFSKAKAEHAAAGISLEMAEMRLQQLRSQPLISQADREDMEAQIQTEIDRCLAEAGKVYAQSIKAIVQVAKDFAVTQRLAKAIDADIVAARRGNENPGGKDFANGASEVLLGIARNSALPYQRKSLWNVPSALREAAEEIAPDEILDKTYLDP